MAPSRMRSTYMLPEWYLIDLVKIQPNRNALKEGHEKWKQEQRSWLAFTLLSLDTVLDVSHILTH